MTDKGWGRYFACRNVLLLRSSLARSVGARHAEIDGLGERRLVCAVGEDGERVARDIAIVAGALGRIGDGIVALDELLRIDEVVRRLIALFQRALPEVA